MLHHTIAAIRAETWEAINQALLASAKQDRLESGATVRLDSTVTAALMHEPSDSALLWDAMRVMTRLLRRAGALPGAPAIQWRDRRRLAKKRASAIEYSRGQDKKRRLYRELITGGRLQFGPAGDMADHLEVIERIRYEIDCGGFAHEFLAARFRHNNRHCVEKDRRCASQLQISLEQLSISSRGATDMRRDDLQLRPFLANRHAQGFDKSTICTVTDE